MTNQPNRRPRYVHRQRADNPLHPLRNRVRAELGQKLPPPDEPMPSVRVTPEMEPFLAQMIQEGDDQ